MPGEKHYFDAPNDADFLEKFVQHHADPAKRHISQYEANRIRKITEDFLTKFDQVKTSQPLDSRMISVIFAWPQGLNAPSRVQAFNPK